VTADSI